MASQSVALPPWSDLLPELLGRIAVRCTKPVDRASFRAVCRSWHLAVRHHCPRMPLTPWVLLPNGSFLTLADGHRDLPSKVTSYGCFVKPSSGAGLHRLPLPENTTCVGYSNGWLALEHHHRGDYSSLSLHDPFSNTTVPLPEVDAISAKAPWPRVFDVLKVLMRSTADDVVVFMSDNSHYPLVLSLPGKSASVPEPQAPPFAYIIDIAFLGDRLYGITKAEDLFSFDLALHDHVPAINSCTRVIRHPGLQDPNGYDYLLQWSDVEEEEYDSEDGGSEEEEALSDSEHASQDSDEYEYDSENEALLRNQVPLSVDIWFDEDEQPPVRTTTIRYLVESRGRLILVRRQLRMPENLPRYTRKVEVFEADTEVGAWVPVVGGLCDGGQALFLAKRFSKSVAASEYGEGRLDEDAIYFMDTAEVFHMRTGGISPALWCLDFWEPTWAFPPDLS
ncbi:hypothetical protein EJB05_57646, partial [Eragrostis curvula]